MNGQMDGHTYEQPDVRTEVHMTGFSSQNIDGKKVVLEIIGNRQSTWI